MAFVHGKNAAVLIGSANLAPYLQSFDISTSVETAETTTYGANAKTYLPGLEDGSVSLSGLFDGSPNAVDERLRAALYGGGDVVVSLLPSGNTIGAAAHICKADQTSYEINSSVGDICQISAELQADGGIHRGVVHAHLVDRVGDQTHPAQDHGAASSNGGMASLHVTDLSGGASATIKVQHSADGGTWVDLITFTPVAGTTHELITVPGTVYRYTRAIATIAGSITYAVAFARGN